MKIILYFFFIFTTSILKADSRYIDKNYLQRKYPFNWLPAYLPNYYIIPSNNKKELFTPNSYESSEETDLIEENSKYCPCTGSAVCECPAGCNCQEKHSKNENVPKCPCTGADVCVCGEDSPCKGKCNAPKAVVSLDIRSSLSEPHNTIPDNKDDQPRGCACTGNLICECPEDGHCRKTCTK